MEVNMY